MAKLDRHSGPARHRGLLAMAAVLLLFLGCAEDRPQKPEASGRLSLELVWETARTKTLAAARAGDPEAAVPVIERVDLQVHRSLDFTEILLAEDGADIEAGQTSFHLEVEVAEGEQTSVEVAASGSIVNEPAPPEEGTLFFGRVEGLTVVSGEETPARVTLRPYFPRALTAGGTVEEGYRIDWPPVPGAEDYRVRRFVPGGANEDTVVTDTFFVADPDPSGEITERLLHRVRAENRYFTGAFSDTIGVAAARPTIPAPTGFTAEAISADSIGIRWGYPQRNPDAFHLERQLLGTGGWDARASIPGSDTLFYDVEVERATTYVYRIRAQLNEIFSSYAGPDSATTPLEPPARPSAVETEQRTVLLSWDYPPPDPTEFGIWKRDVSGGGEWVRTAVVPGSERSFEDPDVVAEKTYEYAVDAGEGGMTSPRSESVTITLSEIVVSPPSDLTATATGPAQIDLVWTDNSENENLFLIERRAEGEQDFQVIDSVLANVELHTDDGLASRTVYTYRVRAWNTDDEVLSEPSNEAEDRTWPPAVPFISVATVSDDTLKVDWLYSETDPELFFLERRISAEPGWTALDGLPGSLRQYVDPGLSPRTWYTYRLRAFEQGDHSPYSGVDSAATAPEPPSSVTATETEQVTVDLLWEYATPDPESFEILRRHVETQEELQFFASTAGSDRHYEDDAVDFDETYEYALVADDPDFGRSKTSTAVQITILGGGPPAAPSDLSAMTLDAGSIQLAWTDNSDDELRFVIERKDEGETTFSTIDSLPADTAAFIDAGLAARTTYTYRVLARNLAGDSTPSNEAFDRTLPPAPTGLDTEGADVDDLELSWSYPSPDPDLFQIEYRPSGETTWQSESPLPGSSRSTLLTELLPRTLYELRMLAEDSGDSSAYSEILAGQSPPPPPTGFAATFDDVLLQVDLGWVYTDPPDPDHFELERWNDAGGDWQILDADLSGSSRGTTDTGVEFGKTYQYRLRAVDLFAGGADSVASDWAYVEIEIVLSPPDPPSGLAAFRDPDGIRLTWDASTGIVERYEIHRRRMQDAAFSQIDTVSGGVTDFVDTTVLPARTYAYVVRAANEAGVSSFSNTADATTAGWRQIQVAGTAPSSRRGHCGVWTDDDDRILIFGGGSQTAPLYDLWEYNPSDSSWTEVAYDGYILPRYRASAAYDPTDRYLLVEGGTVNPYSYGGFSFERNSGIWDEICLGEALPLYQGREGTGTAWSTRMGGFYSFGGFSDDGVNQTYYTDFRAHRQTIDCSWVSAEADPSPRSGPVVLAHGSDEILLFGGRDSSTIYNDLYKIVLSLDLPAWVEVQGGDTGDVPSPRYEADGAIDSDRQRLYLLGGYTSFNESPTNDLYVFDFSESATWIQLDAGGSAGVTDPDASDGVLAVDPATGSLYHIGPGSDRLEVWLYIP